MTHRVLLITAILIGLLLKIPSPEAYLIDPDHGQQLAGAQQITAGEHPFVDFRSAYGPLSFYPSAAAQIISSNRISAELAVDVLGYLLAYLCFFAAVRRLTDRRSVAYASLVVAVVLAPPMYKYYIAMGPLLVLVACYRYIERPEVFRLALLAASVAITGLFRPDYGAYTALTACAAIYLAQPAGRHWRAMSLWALLVFACAMPWLVFVTARGGLAEYLYSSMWGSLAQAQSLTLPLPWPGWHRLVSLSNAKFASFAYFWVLPAVCAALVWRARGPQLGCDWRMVIVAVILAQLTLVQSIHRSDHRHLVEAIPASLVLVVWFTEWATRAVRGASRHARLAGAAGIAATGMAVLAVSAAALRLHDVVVASPMNVAGWLIEYSGSRSALVNRVRHRDPENWQAETIEYIRRCTAPDERVLALPYFTSYYHLSERKFGGGHMYISPGFFNRDSDQRRLIEILESQQVPLIVDMPGLGIDGRSERRVESMAPIVAEYFRKEYLSAGRIGAARVRIHRNRLPEGTMDIRARPPCPVPAAISPNDGTHRGQD